MGVYIAPEKFVDEIGSTGVKIVGLSVLMTTSFEPMKHMIDLIRKAKGNAVKVMVGGGPTNETVAEYVQADGYGSNAIDAVRIAKQWLT